jgi:hypothetical protein
MTLRPRLTAASWVRMIHLARVLGLGRGAGIGPSWRVMRGPWAASPAGCGAAPAGAGQRPGLPSVTTCSAYTMSVLFRL